MASQPPWGADRGGKVCDPTHGYVRGRHLDSSSMEWMLQAVDEVDDAVSALRLFAMGWSAEIGLFVSGSAAACAVCAAVLRTAG
jgi:hypothetical protein